MSLNKTLGTSGAPVVYAKELQTCLNARVFLQQQVNVTQITVKLTWVQNALDVRTTTPTRGQLVFTWLRQSSGNEARGVAIYFLHPPLR